MNRFIGHLKETIPYDCFSDLEVARLVPGTQNKRYALVKRAIVQGDLIHLRRGFYCLAERYRREALNLFTISQKIYGPSCVSLESALSYHGWIPEAVYTVTCVTSQRSKDFETPLGKFSYKRLPLAVLFSDVERVSSGGDSFLMARPWRALADYVFVYKKDWKNLDPLIESLRIDEEFLLSADVSELKGIAEAYQNRRVAKFISGVIREIEKRNMNEH
jgi:hypothetical protein